MPEHRRPHVRWFHHEPPSLFQINRETTSLRCKLDAIMFKVRTKGQVFMRSNLIALGAGLVLWSLTAVAEQPLRSPWDSEPVTMTSTPYTCPATPNITPDLTT